MIGSVGLIRDLSFPVVVELPKKALALLGGLALPEEDFSESLYVSIIDPEPCFLLPELRGNRQEPLKGGQEGPLFFRAISATVFWISTSCSKSLSPGGANGGSP